MILHKLKRISHNVITFIEFDRNFNFVPDNILLDIVARSINHENCSPCRMNFIRYRIVDSLME